MMNLVVWGREGVVSWVGGSVWEGESSSKKLAKASSIRAGGYPLSTNLVLNRLPCLM